MTTQEHLAELGKNYGVTSVIVAAVRHILKIDLANEIHQQVTTKAIVDLTKRLEALEARLAPPPPESPAVPDPQPEEIWANNYGTRVVSEIVNNSAKANSYWGRIIWFVEQNGRKRWAALCDWHAWVRETQARRIWPEGGGA